MTTWTTEELALIGRTDEVQVASRLPDGTLQPYVTIWVVQAGDGVYVRSAYGPANPWFRRALASGTGRVRIGAVERDVAYEVPDAGVHAEIDAAYHAKYDRYGHVFVGAVVGRKVVDVTLRLVPRAGTS